MDVRRRCRIHSVCANLGGASAGTSSNHVMGVAIGLGDWRHQSDSLDLRPMAVRPRDQTPHGKNAAADRSRVQEDVEIVGTAGNTDYPVDNPHGGVATCE